MDKKYGVYICTGCGIGDAMDIDTLIEAAEENNVQSCKTSPFLCGKEGVEMIKKDIEEEGINTIIIAACSGRVNYDVFDFGSDKIVERANIREQVAWVHEPDGPDAVDEEEDHTGRHAADVIHMAYAKVKSMELPEPYKVEEPSKAILVVGGGMAGITAALESANAGYKTVLVEKEAKLGGWLNKLYKVTPLKAPYTELEDPNVDEKVKELEEHPNITVYTSAKIKKIAGAPGMFDAVIDVNGSEVQERIGAIVLAAGSQPVDAEKLSHLGYGSYKNVVTHAELEEMAKNGKIVRPSDGQEAKKIAFIQCAGSRDPERLPYCSHACCIESLKQAAYVSELNPEAMTYIFYKDIRSSGTYEHFYKKIQETGAVFIKGDITGITESGDGTLTVESEDVLLGGKASVEGVDLVVLATGMVPNTAFGKELEVEADDEGAADEKEEKGTQDVIIASDILNLDYRQGPELPALKYGFPDSHYICFPYETRRTGIYAAGSVRAPMDMAKAITDATGAALKAIQCVEATAQGAAVHPRSGDLSYPEFNLNRCTQCKRCTEECPFGAINEDEKTNPLINPTRCRRCGTCMGACPERIISFKNYSVPMIGNMIKAIEMPEEDEEKPRILVFACENDAIPALDMAGINRLKYNPWVRVIPVRCLGSLNLVWIADAMSEGYDGVLLMGCKHGDDYQCHFIKGSELAEIRLSKVSETLDRLGLESERVRAVEVNIMDYMKIPQILDEFAEELEELGPNPMKDF
ncbi:quinone-modifying oxidoreductase subunit QmoB [Desulfohalotomaculum tongense]|uniref:hydrogenase iron-sulfur subunit n=1 Tax=Desulforadius tongensis TaxID=1216062 RepID=UPI00195B81BF|nr:hydrogenase iron-sulfur subunit [Desulforadius tongensis]MBM7856141.1 quinone-modifying oxidoreductase subunit QmoB [Desulforadius tongensis]